MSEGIRVLLFSGSDFVGRNGPNFLRRAVESGYTLLATDPEAISLTTREKLPYLLIDDFIDSQAILKALELAQESESNWYEPAGKEFTVNGICWPELDRFSMSRFWRDAMLALTLANELNERRTQELKLFGSFFRRPSIVKAASDVPNVLLKAELGNRLREVRRFNLSKGPFNPSNLPRVLRRLGTIITNRKKSSANTCQSDRGARIVLLLLPDEAHRFDNLVEQLSKSMPGKVTAVFTASDQQSIDVYSARWQIPVMSGPTWPLASWASAVSCLSQPIHTDLAKRFVTAYRKARDAAVGKPWHKPMERLEFHFNYYLKYLWPRLCSYNMQFWSEFWKNSYPDVLLVTWRSEHVQLVATAAAKHIGIPTISVPHGGIHVAHENAFVTDYVLYENGLQKRGYEHVGVPKRNLLPCRGILPESEFPARSVPAFSELGKWRILALTEPIHPYPGLVGYVRLGAQLEALRALNSPPEEISPKVDLAIKVHPKYPEKELIVAAGHELLEKVLPQDSELNALLDDVDLVVGVNYFGTALVHALSTGKPVVSFMTERGEILRKSRIMWELFSEGVTQVGTPAEFWKVVQAFFTDAGFAEAMRSKATEFSHYYLDQSDFPTVIEAVNNCLARCTDIARATDEDLSIIASCPVKSFAKAAKT